MADFAALTIIIVVCVLAGLACVAARRRKRVQFAAEPEAAGIELRRLLIVGSGQAACSLAAAIREKHPRRYAIVGCVDEHDAPTRRSGFLARLGPMEALEEIVALRAIDEVLVAIPYAPRQLVSHVERCCKAQPRPVTFRVVPGVLEHMAREPHLVPFESATFYEKLLGRNVVTLDESATLPHIRGRVVLVTGAGGSIGSEICRQLARLQPRLLVLLGHGENSLFRIKGELEAAFGFRQAVIVLADVADAERMRDVFGRYRPHLVFHAAAHKHVPITQSNVAETCRNNVLGTHVVALASAAYGAAKFVMVSTDKAVAPTSVLGTTKRLGELICQSLEGRGGTEFVCVRFGNVLGSRGSVVPVFLEQIERGGPITITHRDMERYFMMIPEAAALILASATVARDGQVCILNMGQPVRILTLAERLIEACGRVPYRDIGILETGIREGEKLTEELFTDDERTSALHTDRFSIASQRRPSYDALALEIRRMSESIALGRTQALLAQLERLTQPPPQRAAIALEATQELATA